MFFVIKKRINKIFLTANLPAPYILYRSIMFKKESPHNLLPTQRSPKARKGWTVFLIFNGLPLQESNINQIIAFCDDADNDNDLPRLQTVRLNTLNVLKADIAKIPSRYRFSDVANLEKYITRKGA